MSVNKADRRESKIEFDNVYNRILNDAVTLVGNKFYAKGEILEKNENYIRTQGDRIMKVVSDIGTYIKMANSIYPQYQAELEERRLCQDKAIGLCYDLVTKYQNLMIIIKMPSNKHVAELQNIYHEINCLKNWRKSDNSRFKNLG